VKRGNLTVHFNQGSVRTHIRLSGQHISHIVGNLFRLGQKLYKLVNIRLSYCKNKKGISFFWDTVYNEINGQLDNIMPASAVQSRLADT